MNVQTVTMREVREFNRCYDNGDFFGSEATRKNVEAMARFIKLRDEEGYQYPEDCSGGPWERLDITDGYHRKYGLNYIYLDHTRKLYRIRETIGEYYGSFSCVD